MKRYEDGGFTRLKRILVGTSGVAMLVASIILSKNGVGFVGEAAWIGLVIAVSLTCAEFMFNSNFDEMNWTTLVLGIGAYGYSISTNINGFYNFQGIDGTILTNFDMKSVLGGIFMDVYPELAIAWALKESKVGDLVGNIVKSWVNPEKMTQAQTTNNNPPTTQNNRQIPSSIPKKNDNDRDNRNNNQNTQNRFTNQNQQINRVSQEPRTPRPTNMNDISREPSYHKMINMANLTEQELQKILDEKNKKGGNNRYDA